MIRHAVLGEKTQARIHELLGDEAAHSLVWCALPRLGKKALIAAMQRETNERMSSRRGLVRLIPSRRKSKPFAQGQVLDGTLRVHKTENERLAVGGRETDPILVTPAHFGSERRAIGTRLYRKLLRVECELGVETGSLARDTFRAMLYMKTAAAVFDVTRPERLLHAAEEHVFARAFVHEARTRGIPSILVHHAPFNLAAWSHDISADLVLTRGTAESAFLEDLGVRREQIHTIGDPAIETLGLVSDPTRAAVVAIYGSSVAQSVDLVTRVMSALELEPDEVVLAPHPRRRAHAIDVAQPLGIRSLKGRTIDGVLELRPRLFVCTYSTGVRIEVEAVGVPTVSLGTAAFAFETGLPVAESPGDFASLPQQVAELRHLTTEDRAALGRRWIDAVGPEARGRREEVLQSTSRPQGPALDVWGVA